MNAIAKFRLGCLWLLVASGFVIVSLIGAANFFFRPNVLTYTPRKLVPMVDLKRRYG